MTYEYAIVQGIYNWVNMECNLGSNQERCIKSDQQSGELWTKIFVDILFDNTLINGTHSEQVCHNNGTTLVDGTRSVLEGQYNMVTF